MTLSARSLLASVALLALLAFPSEVLAQNGGPVQGHDGPVPFLDLTGKATIAAPTTASTGRAKIFFDTTKGKLQQSISNGAWADLSGGGGGTDPWTRTGTTIAPTTTGDVTVLGATPVGGNANVFGGLRVANGLNLSAGAGTLVGPYDDDTLISAGGGSLILQSGNANNEGQIIFRSGTAVGTVDTVGQIIETEPGYSFQPNTDGFMSLGAVGLGFSALHLTSAAGLSWNDDTVISRASSGHFNFGTSAGGQDGWLLAQKMALTDTGTGKEVDFDVSTAGALALTSGAWLRFDNTGISQVSTSTIAAGSTAGGGDATVSLGTPGITTTITTSTSGPVALPATSTHNNAGAGGSVTFNLGLSAPTGTTQSFRVVAAQNLVIQAPNGVTVYMGSTASSSGGTWTSNAPGSTATYEYQGSSVWIATSWDGTWTHS